MICLCRNAISPAFAVRQWCDSVYKEYAADGAEMNDPGMSGAVENDVCRVLRGGSFYNPPSRVRSAYRLYDVPTTRFIYYGFRVARTYVFYPP